MRINLDPEQVIMLGEANRYTLLCQQDNIKMLSMTRKAVRINIYYSTGTVGTCIYHPRTKKKTQLFRKGIDMRLLKEIFINPRVHTSRGYRQKKHHE